MFTANSANQVTNSLLEDALQNAYNTLNSFAGSEDFLSKIKTAFGESFDATKLENLRQQWLSGNFESLPAIEIRTDAELQGANAAYAGSTNTIYFSQDFLSKYANNPQAISAVLIEEIGHYVDWQTNTADTPGDEGELFSALVRGVSLSQEQVQQMKQDNDSVVLNLGGKLAQIEKNAPIYDYYTKKMYGSSNPLTIKEITKLYLFGTDDPSSPDYNPHIRDANHETVITYNMKDFMYNGPGKYASPTVFGIVSSFFEADYIKPGEYDVNNIGSQLPLFWSKKTELDVYQYGTDIWGSSDHDVRSYIFGKTSFKLNLNIDLKFIVEDKGIGSGFNKGNRRIEELEVRPYDDNFNFKGSEFPSVAQTNDILEKLTDPYGIGRTVNIQYRTNLGQEKAPDRSGNYKDKYTYDQYKSDKSNQPFISTEPWQGSFGVGIKLFTGYAKDFEKELHEEKFLKYERDGLNVIYGSNGGDNLDRFDFKVKKININGTEIIDGITEAALSDKELPSDARYLIVGGAGDDIITGYLFDDELQGGKGLDKLYGDDGNDILNGGEDKDELFGQGGNDDLRGEDGSDDLWGGTGEDWLYGGWDTDNSGDDVNNLYGQSDSDRLFGEDGNDYLDGGNEDNAKDYLYGGKGNDILYGWGGDDYIDGETGVDTVQYTGSPNGVVVNIDESVSYSDGKDQRKLLSVDSNNPIGYYLDLSPSFFIDAGQAQDGFGFVDNLRNIENILASPNNDVLIGNALGNKIEAFGGDDFLIGNAGNDILDGGEGINTVSYRLDPSGVSVNLLTGQAIDGWGNTDALIGISNVVGSDSSGSGDKIIGNQGTNKITGGFGDDRIDGQGGNDWLYGEFGNDILIGGLGPDRIYGNQGIDIIWGDLEGNPDAGDNDYIRGGSEKDIIHAGGGDDIVWGDSGYGDDEIWGDAGNDTLYGEAGDDYLEGNLGNDILYGGIGTDTLLGNEDDDKLYGNEGEDILKGGEGADEIYGGKGEDSIWGEIGFDTIDGGAGSDTIDYSRVPSGVVVNIDENRDYDNEQNPGEFDLEPNFEIDPGTGLDGYGTVDKLKNLENILGTAFNDILIGNNADNHIQAGAGDDLIISSKGNDIYAGEDGIDVISFRRDSNGVYVELKEGYAKDGFRGLDTIAQIENVVGSQKDDQIYGDDIANTITGGKGEDTINGRGNNDLIYGEEDDDLIYGEDGEDTIFGNDDKDTLDGGLGNDTLSGGEGNDQLLGQGGNDTLDGGENNDTLSGGDNEDILFGQTGADSLLGGTGNDSLDGGKGDDRLYGEAGNDTLDAGSGNDTLSGGDDDDTLWGQTGNDSLTGGNGNDSLDAGEGNDELYGELGNDTLDASLGNDTLSGGDDDDVLLGQTGNDTLDGGNGNDYLDAGEDKDTLTGGNDNDTLIGRAGEDLLDGGEGNDRLFGDENNDTLSGGNGEDYIEGGKGSDRISGDDGNDTLFGQSGQDSIDGGAGNDSIDGGLGNDTLIGQIGDDTFTGGGDRDWIIVKLGDGNDVITDFGGVGRGANPLPEVRAEVDTIQFIGSGLTSTNLLMTQVGEDLAITFEDIENTKVTLRNFALENIDNLHTSKGAFVNMSNIFFNGNQTLFESDTFDVINSEELATRVYHKDVATFLNDLDNNTKGYNDSNDIINGQGGNDTLSGLSGNDTLRGGEGNDSLLGGVGNDYLKGDAGNDTLFGELGNDSLKGNAGEDFLFGGQGNDTLFSGTENDTLTGGGDRDLIVIKPGDGTETITDFGAVGTGIKPSEEAIAEVDTLKFVGAGLTAKNLLLTQSGSDLIVSFEGVANTQVILQNVALENIDNIWKSRGATLDIGNILFDGNEDIKNSDSFDVIDADEITDQISHANTATFLNDLDNNTKGKSNSADVINGQGGNDTLTGLSGDDILRGGEGDDLLNGGVGKDTLNGGAGKDIFVLAGNTDFDIIADFTIGQDLIALTGGLTMEQLTINSGVNGIEISFQNQAIAVLNGLQTPLANGDFTII